MPHQTPHAPNGTAQNAATDCQMPGDHAREEDRRPEPRSYAAPDVADSTLAPPAAGEMGDYADEGDASGGMQQGADRTRRGEKDAEYPQGPKTQAAQRRMMDSGSKDQGTQ
jgi:hypothetical protein